MMLIAITLLSLLFIVGLSLTVFKFQTNKLIEWIQSFLAERFSQHVRNKPAAAADKKPKRSAGSAVHNKAELRSVFATFDKNNDGFITKKELSESLNNIGIHMTLQEVEEMVEKVDSNGDGLIDLDEFCELFESVVGLDGVVGGGGEEEEEEEEGGSGGGSDLKEAFDVFDGDRDGLITVEELGMVLSSLGLKEGQRLESCKEMIRKVDMDGDGKVNFDEFKKMMKSSERLIPVS
ncbi:hypothetical protein CsSME_00051448 [Camellia sinensis var. sinensis]